MERYSYDAYGWPVIKAVNICDADYDGVVDYSDFWAVYFVVGKYPCWSGPLLLAHYQLMLKGFWLRAIDMSMI